MSKLEPAWADELLRDWANESWKEAQMDLGMPKVCPSFKGLTEISDEVDVGGYSPAEVKAIAAAVEYLHVMQPEHYRVLCRHFRPWLRGKLQKKDGDDKLLPEAIKMVAEYVDKVLG